MSSLAPPTSLVSPIRSRYESLVAAGALEPDPAQLETVGRLEALAGALERRRLARKSSPLGWLLGQRNEPIPRGLYLWGEVGRGKTMLMDLFFEGLRVQRKRRAHFHAYMAEVHERIHAWRQRLKAGEVTGDDPIRPVAEALAREAWVLCFDEFAVTDIADAMILGRLFTALFAEGVVVVATSNRPPGNLYEGGLNRALFLPFIALLEERMDVVELRSRTDFRLEKLGDQPVYLVPADEAARDRLDEVFVRLTGGARPAPGRLAVHGHAVEVPLQAMGVARFGFDDLCRRAYGTSDYLALARAFHTLVIDGIPRLGAEERNEARRFITLIDILYENQVKLVASAAAEADELYRAETGGEAFEFARTASRLHEMRSRDYLARPAGRSAEPSGNTTGLVET
ncbi:MAG: AFG1 family ATPase [Methylobacteriaceae bacterium]|nr:AFG1 family ATPase [Methylobacteriaceae bacterium]